MMRRIYIYLMIMAMVTCSLIGGTAYAIEPADSTYSIIDVIMGPEGSVAIVQPDVLTERLMHGAVIKSTGGSARRDKKVDPHIRYRVQVFSDNNRQSAKANAEYRKRLIEQRMPGMRGYVTYDAPYWRVRVGNYQTEAEAQTAMKQIKSNFPAFSGDVRVVKVRVD